jgi:hypothetical protein
MAACITLGSTGFGGLCLEWVQNELGLKHEGDTAYDAWVLYSGRGLVTGAPQKGDMAFFAQAPINGNMGHVGIVQADGSIESILNDGSKTDCPVTALGAPLLGYISTAGVQGKPVGSPVVANAGSHSALLLGGLILFGLLALEAS